jgi:hypothetical protein
VTTETTEPRLIAVRRDAGRERPTALVDLNTAVPTNRALNGAAPLAISGLLPSQVFERTRWQRRYVARRGVW